MAAFDSIVNVDEWISDYYLTTDETKGESFGKRAGDAVRDWKKEDKEFRGEPSPWARLTGLRNELETALSTIDVANQDTVVRAAEMVEQAFGYPEPTEVQLDGITFQAGRDGAYSMVVLRATPISSVEDVATARTLAPITEGDKTLDLPLTKLITEIFLAERHPAFVVIIAGTWVILAERESWPLGRYLAVDVALAVERNDTKNRGELQRVVAILAREHVARHPDGTTWWAETLEESHEHAVKVSEDLRQAIKESIEIIGNDVLDRYREQGRSTEDLDGNELAKQALRYLYRILFLLFAEASPELNILPAGDPDYDDGYGLSNLRDQVLSEPATEPARQGTYLYDSLNLLFRLVNEGHDPQDPDLELFDATANEQGLTFRNLSADLFLPAATSYINPVGLSNAALHRVLQNLLLTRESAGRDRGFVSYATLGVTQLGQVYEGLMSYTGYIAERELFEVAPNGDASKGSWVVTPELAGDLPRESFVKERDELGRVVEERNRRYAPGEFVYRQSSRDRERSASFYTPPVLTSFTVGQAIEVLRESGRISQADDILDLTICEPAMGSGAFAVEAVNQLAELYLTLKQDELGEQIPAEEITTELQKVKASIALHQVYGVDLNKTAVELAEISLWLDTMTAELKAPWFGLHLRQGNSLIGATRSTLAADDLTTKKYLKAMPKHHPVTTVATAIEEREPDPRVAGRVHHFLVPSSGWGAAADSKDLKDVAADEIKAMKDWRKTIQQGFSDGQVTTLKKVAQQVERLWQFALVRLQIAEEQIRRDVSVWGHETKPRHQVVTRAEVEEKLFDDKNGSYQRLRLVMDAWNALWFWPLTSVDELPTQEEWVAMLVDAFGTHRTYEPSKGEETEPFGADTHWHDLTAIEDMDAKFTGRKTYEELLEAHPWLRVAEQVAADQAFFHWDLDFAVVMARGGFDFQVGNPPWVRPRTDVDALLSEHDPWFSLAHKPTQAEKKERRETLADRPGVLDTLARGLSDSVVTSKVLGDVTRFPHLANQQPDLYRGFMERTWANANADGVVSLIHPESHFTEKKAAPLRAGAYRRLRRHWQFVNELVLFDIDHHVKYGIHIYGSPLESPKFIAATSLYHPQTVMDSLVHDGTGPLPGFKDPNNNWDLRPHRDRIQTVDGEVLEVWRSILEEPGTPLLETRTLYSVNTEAAGVLAKLSEAPRIKELGLQFSSGWHETSDRKKGYFDTSWQHPDSWDDVILQGPHLGVSTPMIKQPNPTMKHNQDWSEIDLEAIGEDFIPATAYLPNRGSTDYDEAYTHHMNTAGERIPDRDNFRFAWRKMAATTGFRTLYSALIPKKTAISGSTVTGVSLEDETLTVTVGAFLSSLLSDYVIRSTGVANIYASVIEHLPMRIIDSLRPHVDENFLRLNCLTSAYAPLWEEVTGEKWTMDTPLRTAKERWHAQNEIDAIVALSLGVTADELVMIYQTQFPVMYRYDQEDLYDVNGRLVAKDVAKLEAKLKPGEQLGEAERTWTHPQSGVEYVFEYPFAPLDREADLRGAYAKYEAMM